MRFGRIPLFLLYSILFTGVVIGTACGDAAPVPDAPKDSLPATPPPIVPQDTIPQQRDTVSQQPVAVYSEKTDDPLNDWYFKVRLFETPQTFRYVIKMDFEEIRGTDTLRLPNLGTKPQPVLKKGEEKYSCIIGFMDQHQVFQPYKKVYVENNSLKITALRQFKVVRRTLVPGAGK